MESKTLENKKLTRTLIIAGCGLLFLFIVLRLLFRANGITESENPDIVNTEYSNVNLPKNKTNQEKLQSEEKKKNELTPEQKNEYVYNDFNTMIQKTGTTVAQQPVNDVKINSTEQKLSPTVQQHYKVESSAIAIQQSLGEKTTVNQQREEKNMPANEETEVSINNNSVFGTVKREDNASVSYANSFEGKKAEAYGDQKVSNGGAVVIRNKEKIVTEDGLLIPKNSIITGKATFSGNRVEVVLNKVQSSNGTFNINMYVLDHDNIEGIYYKAPIDDVKDGAIDNTNPQANNLTNQIPFVGGLATGIANGMIKGSKDLLKKSRVLDLTDGYHMYIIPKAKKR